MKYDGEFKWSNDTLLDAGMNSNQDKTNNRDCADEPTFQFLIVVY